MTWLTGWIVPCGSGRGSRVMSVHSPATRASSAASARRALAPARAAAISSLRALSAGPAVWRSSGLMAPSSRIRSATSPFLPRAASRTSSSAGSSPAAAMAVRYFSRMPVMSSTSRLSGMPGRRLAQGTAIASRRPAAPAPVPRQRIAKRPRRARPAGQAPGPGEARRRWRLGRSGRPEARAAGRGVWGNPVGGGSGRGGPGRCAKRAGPRKGRRGPIDAGRSGGRDRG